MLKSPEAFRTISEVAETLDVPPHVLRFWETRFAQVKPVKRGGGRRYYRPEDVRLLRGIRGLLYDDGMTIKGVQKILRERGIRHVIGLGTVDDQEPETAAAAAAAPATLKLAPEPLESGETVAREFKVEEFDTGERSAGQPRVETAPEPDPAPVNEPAMADAAPGPAPSGRDPAKPQADLFASGDRPAAPAGGTDQPSPSTASKEPGDKAALRELIARLEALRTVMTEDRRS